MEYVDPYDPKSITFINDKKVLTENGIGEALFEALSPFQTKALLSPLIIDGVEISTVEQALHAINTARQQVPVDWNATSGVTAIRNKPVLANVATTGSYDSLSDTPNLATVATTGDYDDLINKPTIPAAQVNSDWNATCGVAVIQNKPTLSTVACTGCYNDLLGKPDLSTIQQQADWAETDPDEVDFIRNKPSLATVACTGQYADLIGRPNIAPQVNADWNAVDGPAYICNKPSFAEVAFTGSYCDLRDRPVNTSKTYTFEYADEALTVTAHDLFGDTEVFNEVINTIYAFALDAGVITVTDNNGDTQTISLTDDYYTKDEIAEKILDLIPEQASSSNQLADKAFVNSSIATNTAYFCGTCCNLACLCAMTATPNDYAFYEHTDSCGNCVYDRYKYNANCVWVYEYTLNNSSFTAEQWCAINSGITDTAVAKITDVYNCTITLKQGNCTIGSFTLNQNCNCEICIDAGSVTGIDVCCDGTCICTINDSTALSLGCNAFSNAAFTTCTGTLSSITVCNTCQSCVATIDKDHTTLVLGNLAFCDSVGTVATVKVGDDPYSPVNGVVSLPAYPPDLSTCAGLTYTGTVTSVNVSVNGCTGTAVTSSGTVTLTNVRGCVNICAAGATDCNRPIILPSIANGNVIEQNGNFAYSTCLSYNTRTNSLKAPLFTSDGTAIIEVGYNNELNIKPVVSGTHVWLNYRCGANTVKIGDGTCTGCLGTLCAATVCSSDGKLTTCTGTVSSVSLNGNAFTISSGAASLTGFNFEKLADATSIVVCDNTICRQYIYQNMAPNGWNTRFGIGYERHCSQWGCLLLSIGCNDVGTLFHDYKFTNTGDIQNVTSFPYRCEIGSAGGATIKYVQIQTCANRASSSVSFSFDFYSMNGTINLDETSQYYCGSVYGGLNISSCIYACSCCDCFWLAYTGYRTLVLRSGYCFKVICTTTTAPTGVTFSAFNNVITKTVCCATCATCAGMPAYTKRITSGYSNYLRIRIKDSANWMTAFTIRQYSGYDDISIRVSGYRYAQANPAYSWYGFKAELLNATNVNNNAIFPVYYGYETINNVNYPWVAIATSNYYGIAITDIVNGYAQFSNPNDLFCIEEYTAAQLNTSPSVRQGVKYVCCMSPWQCTINSASNVLTYVQICTAASRNDNSVLFNLNIYSMCATLNVDDGVSTQVYYGTCYGSLGYAYCSYAVSCCNCIWIRYAGCRSLTITSNYPFTVLQSTTTAPTGITFNSFLHCSRICSPYPTGVNQNCCVVIQATCCNASAHADACFCFYGNGVACGTAWCGGTFRNYTQYVDLTGSEYCKNCVYPVTVSVLNRTYSDETIIYVLNALNTGCTADWMNHANGFSAMAEIHTNGSGWGSTTVITYTTRLACMYVKDNGIGTTQIWGFSITALTNASLATLYLRGGAVWALSASNNGTFVPHSTTYTINSQSVSPICVTGSIPQQWGQNGYIYSNIIGNVTGNVIGNVTGTTDKACCVTTYNNYCMDYFVASADMPIMLTTAATSSQAATVATIGRSTACPLTFNPATGTLCTCNICAANIYGTFTGVAYHAIDFSCICAGAHCMCIFTSPYWGGYDDDGCEMYYYWVCPAGMQAAYIHTSQCTTDVYVTIDNTWCQRRCSTGYWCSGDWYAGGSCYTTCTDSWQAAYYLTYLTCKAVGSATVQGYLFPASGFEGTGNCPMLTVCIENYCTTCINANSMWSYNTLRIRNIDNASKTTPLCWSTNCPNERFSSCADSYVPMADCGMLKQSVADVCSRIYLTRGARFKFTIVHCPL